MEYGQLSYSTIVFEKRPKTIPDFSIYLKLARQRSYIYIYIYIYFFLIVDNVGSGRSSVLRLDQPNYYAYFYLKESICSIYMKLSRKFVISVVINLQKNFASHFGDVTRNDV